MDMGEDVKKLKLGDLPSVSTPTHLSSRFPERLRPFQQPSPRKGKRPVLRYTASAILGLLLASSCISTHAEKAEQRPSLQAWTVSGVTVTVFG